MQFTRQQTKYKALRGWAVLLLALVITACKVPPPEAGSYGGLYTYQVGSAELATDSCTVELCNQRAITDEVWAYQYSYVYKFKTGEQGTWRSIEGTAYTDGFSRFRFEATGDDSYTADFDWGMLLGKKVQEFVLADAGGKRMALTNSVSGLQDDGALIKYTLTLGHLAATCN